MTFLDGRHLDHLGYEVSVEKVVMHVESKSYVDASNLECCNIEAGGICIEH